MKIRDVELNSQVIIAPMAGVSNKVFRKILRKTFSGLICAEMVSDKAICYKNERTLRMIDVDNDEDLVSMQVFGGEVNSILEAAKYLDKHCNAKIIDINMGCPVKKVIKGNAGAALLKDPQLVYEIVKAVVDNVNKPVSVKIRSGFDLNSINFLEIGQMIEKAGASAITLHARTRSQMYLGSADYSHIKLLKESLNIPVIGNGDIKSVEDAIKMIEETNCDGIMIGRGMLGNPWLADEIDHYLKTGQRKEKIGADEKIKQAIEHLDELVKYDGEKNGVAQMRFHLAWYLKGLKNSGEIKTKLNSLKDVESIKEILSEYTKELMNDE